MKAELYLIPMGIMGEQVVTTVAVYIPDMNLIVAPGNSSEADENTKEKYENLQKIADIDIPDEDKAAYEELGQAIAEKQDREEYVLSKLDSTISDAVQKFQAEPHIHIPTIDETSQIIGEQDNNDGSGIIIEG